MSIDRAARVGVAARAPRLRLTLPRPRLRPRLAARRRRMVLTGLALVAMTLLLFGAWTWFRDSSLVSVRRVVITGETGGNAGAIRSALRAAARNMTTLDVNMNQLRTAIAPFPEVKRLRASTQFPHRMVIHVIDQLPVAVVNVAGRQVPVAGDGTVLRGLDVPSPLPVISLSVPPVGNHLTEPAAVQAVSVLASAPYQLLPRIRQVTSLAGHGLVVDLRIGPVLYFGDAGRLRAKWLAATAVLADPGSAGSSYIDVTDPARPAAGGGSAASAGTASAASAAAPVGSGSGAATTPPGG